LKPTSQKDRAEPSSSGCFAALARIIGLISATIGMAIAGYLIAQEFNGILTAALAGALTGIVLITRGK